jgi:hypothetical protein
MLGEMHCRILTRRSAKRLLRGRCQQGLSTNSLPHTYAAVAHVLGCSIGTVRFPSSCRRRLLQAALRRHARAYDPKRRSDDAVR